MTNTQTTESIPPSQVTVISIPTSSAVRPVITNHRKFPQKPFEATLIFILNQPYLKH